ncbi:MAG TPA: energy transducer TonB [Chitinophagaceae bacterium]|nr:energy transducer TonB [Chitinophagaceae bacterium]
MKYFSLSLICIILSLAGKGQDKRYEYFFDKDLNLVAKEVSVIYGVGEYEGDHLRLMLYNNRFKQVIVIQHFTDSSLQVSDGLFTSFYSSGQKESEGNYTNNEKDGWWQRWDTSGNIMDSSLYEAGQLSLEKTFTYFPKLTQLSVSDLKNHRSSHEFYDKAGHLMPADTTDKNDEDKVFIKEEIEPAFPGGERALRLYLNKKIKDQLSESDYNGKCIVRFIVRMSGEVTEVQAISGKSDLASIVVSAIKNGPKWLPGQQNGRYVNAYKIITVTYPE